MTANEKRFCQNVIVAILMDAITDARRKDPRGGQAREWLKSQQAEEFADSIGLNPAYYRRIIDHAWLSYDGIRRYRRTIKRESKAEEAAAREQRLRIAADQQRAKELGLTRKQVAFIDAFNECKSVEQARLTTRSKKDTVRGWLKNKNITRHLLGWQASS